MKTYFNNLVNSLRLNWQSIVLGLLALLIAILTVSIQPAAIKNHANIYEAATVQKIDNLENPWYRAVNAPYLLIARAVSLITDSSLVAARLSSTIIILAAVAIFYFLIKIWFNARTATVGAILFLTSSLTLNTAHQATFVSMLVLAPLTIFVTFTWFIRTKNNLFLSFLCFIAALAFSAYTPYMLWFILMATIAVAYYGKKKLGMLKWWQFILAALLYLLILTPLIVSVIGAPGQLKELLGIPLVGRASVGEYFLNILQIVSSTFIYASINPLTFLGNLPVLDVFSAAAAVLGTYFFAKRFRYRRSIIIFVALLMAMLTMALNNNFQVYFALFLPFLYIFVIAGVIELLKQWFQFFPRNPLARNFGVTLVVIAIALVCFYQLQRYYIAWGNAPETKAVYMIKY